MTIDAWLDPETCPSERPPYESMGSQTRALHDAIDANIKQAGVGFLHPSSPTLMLDVLGSKNVVSWQEQKAAFLLMGEGCWSELPHLYARYNTTAGGRLITKVRELENAQCAVLADCGMQATALAFDALLTPDKNHAVLCRQVYNKTRTYLERLTNRLRGGVTVVDDGDHAAIAAAVRDETALIFCETFTNPLVRAQDLDELAAVAKGTKAKLVIDTTIATPWAFETPLLDIDGIDVVVASGTKALGGQDRDMWGYVATNDADIGNQVTDLVALRGGNLDWRRASVIAEGLDEARTLHERRCRNASVVAAFLAQHPKVSEVFHPSLPTHPDAAAIRARYVRHGSLLSFRVDGADEAQTRHLADVLATTIVVRYALSFDGLATKVNHHKSVSEYFTPVERLKQNGFDRLVRIGVGTEDQDDLIAALNWTLHHGASVSVADIDAWQAERTNTLGL